jgi:hypothetical protein
MAHVTTYCYFELVMLIMIAICCQCAATDVPATCDEDQRAIKGRSLCWLPVSKYLWELLRIHQLVDPVGFVNVEAELSASRALGLLMWCSKPKWGLVHDSVADLELSEMVRFS